MSYKCVKVYDTNIFSNILKFLKKFYFWTNQRKNNNETNVQSGEKFQANYYKEVQVWYLYVYIFHNASRQFSFTFSSNEIY